MSRLVSTLTVYDGRLRLGTIDVTYIDGRAEYRARLANGKDLGTFHKQAAARAAVNAAYEELGRQLSADPRHADG
jgi:hypothetical protein